MDMSVPTLHVPRPARETTTPAQALTALWRGRWLALLLGILLAGLGYAGVSQMPRRYTATGTLAIETQRLIPELQGALSNEMPSDAQLTLHTEMQVLQSTPLLLAVIDDLGWADEPARNPLTRPPGPVQRVQAALTALLTGRPAPPPSRDPMAVRLAIVHDVQDHLSIGNDMNSLVISVSYTDADPHDVAALVNTLMRRYITGKAAAHARVDREANATLLQRADEVRAEISALEQKMQEVRVRNSFVMVRAGSVSQQRLEELTSALTKAQDERIQLEARWQRAAALTKTGQLPDEQSDVLDSKTISDLRAREAGAAGMLAELTQRHGPRYPGVVQANAELASVRAQIRAEIKRITVSLDARVQAARTRETDLAEQLRKERSDAGLAATVQAQLADLDKDATAQRAVLQTLLARVEQTSAEPHDASQLPGARIISAADTPLYPSAPRPKLAGAIGLVAGFALGGLLAVMRGGGSGARIMNPAESAGETGLPVLCVVPRLRGGRAQQALPTRVLGDAPDAATEALRVLRTRLHFIGRAAPRSVVFVSSVVGEGASSLAAGFARVAARDGVRTLLLEGDLQAPSLAHLLGRAAPTIGLSEVLEGTAQWRDVLARDLAAPLDLLLASRPRPRAQHLLEGMRLQNLLSEAAEEYNLIVLDAPAVTSGSGALLLAHRADATVLVVGAGVVRRGHLLEAMDRLAGTARNPLAVALNRAG